MSKDFVRSVGRGCPLNTEVVQGVKNVGAFEYSFSTGYESKGWKLISASELVWISTSLVR